MSSGFLPKNKEHMKAYIVFPADIGTHWIGGLYYIRNIIYSVLQSRKIMDRYKILIVTTEDCADVFRVFEPQCELYIHQKKDKIGIQMEYLKILRRYKTAFLYNAKRVKPIFRLGVKPINWIADFQHVHYPEFFTRWERTRRDRRAMEIVKSGEPIVLSSQDAKNDFVKHFGGSEKQCTVVHFVSYIEDEILKLTETFEDMTLKKLGLVPGEYIYIPNQFWKHKNHIVVFQAIKNLINEKNIEKIKFVFSGNINSYKNDCYQLSIQKILNSSDISERIVMVGFLKRSEQLAVMKNAIVMIQPSLFEGWSTVVEDAKVLDKVLLLSDIPIHHEQNYEKSHFFDPHNADQLAQEIVKALKNTVPPYSDADKGIARMRQDAQKYALQLEKLFLVD